MLQAFTARDRFPRFSPVRDYELIIDGPFFPLCKFPTLSKLVFDGAFPLKI
jgi:hypothetical protein